MDEVERQIAAYRSATFDAKGEAWGKTTAIEALEDFLSDDRVLGFFLDTIADPDEYDMARVEVAKVFEVWQAPSERARTLVGRRLAKMLPVEPDVLVQQWGAIAAGNFMSIPELFAAVVGLLADPSADLAVRYNCLAALRGLGPSDRVVAALERLASDPEVGESVRRFLDESRQP